MNIFGVQNANILLIIIGSALLVFGIIGGGIDIKGTKIPQIGAVPRVSVSSFGIILLLVGIIFSVLQYSNQSTPPIHIPIPTPIPTPTPTPTPTPQPALPSLASFYQGKANNVTYGIVWLFNLQQVSEKRGKRRIRLALEPCLTFFWQRKYGRNPQSRRQYGYRIIRIIVILYQLLLDKKSFS